MQRSPALSLPWADPYRSDSTLMLLCEEKFGIIKMIPQIGGSYFMSKFCKCIISVALLFIFAGFVAMPAGADEVKGAKKTISVLIPGNEKDNGFMEAAYRGYSKIKEKLPVNVSFVSNISATSEEKLLTEALRKLAEAKPDMIIAHGGQCNAPVKTVAAEFPEIKFVVIQGNVKGENISSYTVNQEQSAWLAGALAGLSTKTNIVGHISGAWPNPGLRARAAFYDGLRHTNEKAVFLTWFTGNLDDSAINKKAAEAQIAKGADIIYTMLNGGRIGVIDAMKSTDGKVKGIGNVIDWTKVDPKVFIGSAVADASVAIFNAANDFVAGYWKANEVREIGIEQPDVVNLTMSKKVPASVQKKIAELAQKMKSGEIKINTVYEGKEFNPATGEFVDQSFKETLKKK